MGTKERKGEETGRGKERGQSWRFPIKACAHEACWGGDLNSYLL